MPGIPEFDRPFVDIRGDMQPWQMMQMVSAALRKRGLGSAAVEFARIAIEECENDPGMIMTVALLYVRIPGQEPTFTMES